MPMQWCTLRAIHEGDRIALRIVVIVWQHAGQFEWRLFICLRIRLVVGVLLECIRRALLLIKEISLLLLLMVLLRVRLELVLVMMQLTSGQH